VSEVGVSRVGVSGDGCVRGGRIRGGCVKGGHVMGLQLVMHKDQHSDCGLDRDVTPYLLVTYTHTLTRTFPSGPTPTTTSSSL